ncbi:MULTISPECIES: signal recognition particle-docking protein FtsY [unclassified Minwuia]|jgi:fused signal recognition particle receptor|uniref:signal recognition particle-docking protein FtsY n=1 Tax=unclassified Minwuia TaxID=2618799 RepID=UPI002479793C|nr:MULTISPECIES: signal recognition particle-docking protein FtsY [unclassified Minwuia]
MAEQERKGWFGRLKDGLKRSTGQLTGSISAVFTRRKLDDEALEDLEEILIRADLGVQAAARITTEIAKGRYDKDVTDEEVRGALADAVANTLKPVALPLELDAARKPNVVLVVGVNGVGKTTTIGKIAHHQREIGNRVVLCAGDTFRAAAIDQLKIWGERTGAEVVARDSGADSAGLAFDALKRARDVSADLLLIDTAGRLQNKANLMAELEKIVRVLKKQDESAPHAVLLVLDATTGQNAVNQVEVFRDVCQVTGLVMTKLDGSARGGVLVAVADKFGLPVHYVGVGEQAEDLRPFDADDFARALCGVAD